MVETRPLDLASILSFSMADAPSPFGLLLLTGDINVKAAESYITDGIPA
jgi:hypothetical protein